MDKRYVDYDSLEEILGTYVTDRLRSRILDEVKTVDIETAAGRLSVHEKRQILGKDSDVVALQVWQRDDIIAALKAKNADCSFDMVDRVARECRSSLEDCSDGWDIVDAAIGRCMK